MYNGVSWPVSSRNMDVGIVFIVIWNGSDNWENDLAMRLFTALNSPRQLKWLEGWQFSREALQQHFGHWSQWFDARLALLRARQFHLAIDYISATGSKIMTPNFISYIRQHYYIMLGLDINEPPWDSLFLVKKEIVFGMEGGLFRLSPLTNYILKQQSFLFSGAVLKLFCTRKKNVITADMKLVGTLRLLKLRRVCKTLVPRLHYYYALNSFN